ncbi:uncharacterized protein LAESUDRAFT_728733 [Laetiporus sulphureus 93-53]|uniref:Uncharacterized protein n=1 Tax=Laetiporus sulphureus 93-53 TaxID=1314785 RepID=A0A165CY89_9APHY|nr:uncharacterized protein LAESUDRAFT_728733 [Laetiporus sulphureus 93-53]KZT03729.1 hypothetical protein LAESUDRAFT_728733 [Laetiporus sulphureus 93-53]
MGIDGRVPSFTFNFAIDMGRTARLTRDSPKSTDKFHRRMTAVAKILESKLLRRSSKPLPPQFLS